MNEFIEKLKIVDKSPKYYQYYPRLFSKYFEDVNQFVIDDISHAGYCYFQSVLYLDSMIDDQDSSNFMKILVLQEETIKILVSIYGRDSDFWRYWDLRRQEFSQAIQEERALKDKSNITRKEYENLADKKSTFGKVAIDCLYVLSKEKDKALYDLLLKSHYYFSVGFQLYDDVKDFKEDFEKGQFNWAIHTLAKVVDFTNYENNTIILNKLLYVKSVGQEILKESILAFQYALNILMPLKINSEWCEIISEMKNTIEGYLDITNGYLKTLGVKIKLSHDVLDCDSFFDFSSVNDDFVYQGLNCIKTDYLKKYAELKHVMYLSNHDDFDNDCQVHISDTFQRTLLNCSLLSITRKYTLDISSYIENEIDYLIGRLNKDSIGGWSYFPTVNEISADIDDLGQIIQLFLRTENIMAINKHCEQPIKIALSSKYNKHGGIATWIIPNENLSIKQVKQDLFNRTKWGTGPDIEVVANFVHSLYLLDSFLYKDCIRSALTFIKSSQDVKGFWESRWYYGSYYGTYVCLRLLQYFRASCETEISKALNYIVVNQNRDGGFGLKLGVSDVLNTSLAILSLNLFNDVVSHEAIQKAKKYLLNNQQQDGSWDATDFIKPKIQEPYKSVILTTAFALEALTQ